MHRNGWKFVSTTDRKYTFEPCEKEEVVYQLDFKQNDTADEDYMQLYLIVFAYNMLIYYTHALHGHGFFNGLVAGAGTGCILVCIFAFGLYIGQFIRLNRIMGELKKDI